jgi:hypothetical protein
MNELMKKIIKESNIDVDCIERHYDEDISSRLEELIRLTVMECEKHIGNKMGITPGLKGQDIKGNPYTMPGELLEHFGMETIKNENMS